MRKVGPQRTEHMLTRNLPKFPEKACLLVGITLTKYRGFLAGFDGKKRSELGSEYDYGYMSGVCTRLVGKNIFFRLACRLSCDLKKLLGV
jgi:hypothetical protein